MNKERVICLLLIVTAIISRAQDIMRLETYADECAEKSYLLSDAFSTYLACLRQTNENAAQLRIIGKVTNLMTEDHFLNKKDFATIDSILDISRTTFGNDQTVFLPLLEQRILLSSSFDSNFQYEFELYDEAMAIRETNGLKEGLDYERLLRWYTDHLYNRKNLSKEDQLKAYSTLWEVYSQRCTEIDSLDTKLLDDYALQCFLCDDTQTASCLHELKRQYIEKTKGKDNEEYMELLETLTLDYSRLYRDKYSSDCTEMKPEKEKEIIYALELLMLWKKNEIAYQATDIQVLVNALITYRKDTIAAREIAIELTEKIEKEYGKKSKEYAEALDLVISTYEMTDKDVIPLLREVLEVKKEVFEENDPSYQLTQSILSFALSQNHQMQDAIIIQSGMTKDDDINSLTTLASQQFQYGQYKEAFMTYEKAMEYCAAHPQEISRNLLLVTQGAVLCLYDLNDADGLLGFAKKWCEDSRFDDNARLFIFSIVMGMASLPGIVNEDVILFIADFADSHPFIKNSPTKRAEVLEYQANAYVGMLQIDKAEEVVSHILSFLRQSGSDSLTIIKYELYLEASLMAQERWDDAIALNQQMLTKISQIPNYKNFVEYRSLCCRAALYQDQKDHFDEVLRWCSAIDNFNESQSTQLLKNSNYFSNVLFLMTYILDDKSVEGPRYRALYKKGMVVEAESRMRKDFGINMNLFRFTLSKMDNILQQKSTAWVNPFNDRLINLALTTNSDSLAIKLYDFTLLYKQAFLTTENLIRRQILESGNADVKAKFEELQSLRTTIQQYESEGLSTKELNERRIQLEQQLTIDSKMYGDFAKSLHLTWGDVRCCLKRTDMAVEFLKYESYNDGEEYYAALILRSDWNAPKLVMLFSSGQIPEKVYENTNFSRECWEAILAYADGIKDIYFAPVGILYNINIESFPSFDGKGYIAEQYNLHRISSTRQLTIQKDNTTKNKMSAVVYGGLRYDSSTDELVTDAMKYSTPSVSQSGEMLKRELRGAMSGVVFLPGSKIEAENIAGIIDSCHHEATTRLLTGKEGTETSFKALSNQDINIVHISTHGFFNKESDKPSNLEKYNIILQETEDRALTRTGLLFAGAENVLLGEEVPDGVDDGILTAQEISTLNLNHLELVVLSACQTAQGDIRSDGVFGLQRGFKKAGAQSIMMSLWKVDDEATCALMTEFYKNWMQGKTMYDALELAKQHVRTNKEKGWDAPEYWAAFILLDAVN